MKAYLVQTPWIDPRIYYRFDPERFIAPHHVRAGQFQHSVLLRDPEPVEVARNDSMPAFANPITALGDWRAWRKLEWAARWNTATGAERELAACVLRVLNQR